MTHPTLTVATKLGDVTLQFLDYAPERDRPPVVARAFGRVMINGVDCQIDCRLAYITHRHERGRTLEEAEVRFERAYWTYNSNRRVDGGGVTTSSMDAKFDAVANTTLREAYEAHPELQHAAKRWTLAYAVERASKDYEDAEKAERACLDVLLAATKALDLFDTPATEFREVTSDDTDAYWSPTRGVFRA